MRIALTGGGTGGHILPAVAVLEALRTRCSGDLDVCFFGPDNRGERAQVESHGIAFEQVASAAVRGRGPLRVARGLATLAMGTWTASRKLRVFAPHAVFSTGGYGSFPGSVAARLGRRPLVVYLPDVVPGWAVKAERRLATRIATTTEAALAHLPAKKTTITGYPVRRAFFSQTRAEARAALGIPPSERVVVITGATQGAHALNEAVFRALRDLVEESIVFHITGASDFDDAAGFSSGLGPELAERYHVSAFRDDLPTVMLAADVGVMRAGASTLGELPAAALPAVLVPGGFAGGHQAANANWLAAGGAAIVMEEAALRGLGNCVIDLLNDEPRLARMRAASRAMARPGAADAIAQLILEVART